MRSNNVHVEFTNVGLGQDKFSWRTYLREFDGQAIIRAIDYRRVLPDDPDVWYNNHQGIVYLDGLYPVGTFRIIPQAVELNKLLDEVSAKHENISEVVER